MKFTLQRNKQAPAIERISGKFREPNRARTDGFHIGIQDSKQFPNLQDDVLLIETNFRHIVTVSHSKCRSQIQMQVIRG